MKNSRSLLITLLIISISSLSFFIYQTNREKREVKEDLIELSNIKYGLFNVDEWKKILAHILTKKIEEFKLDPNNRKQMKKKISEFLYKVVRDLEGRYYEENSNSISGFFKNSVASLTGAFDKIKEDVPIFTDQILNFLNDPKNKKALKVYLINKLNDYADDTFAKLDYSTHDSIISKYKYPNRAMAISALTIKLGELQAKANDYKYLLMVLVFLTATYIFIIKNLYKNEFVLLTCTCFLFLITGLTLPMIEIDARVSEIKISLLGEIISFHDQVLYYKSKSILEVIYLMISQGSFDLLLVGFLVLAFSVLFPISKLISSICLVLSPSLKSNKLIIFLVFKTSKWSMADVMVVAIFMAYIGFSGILTEQLKQLESLSSKIDVLTTNKSSLQTGFLAFTSFVLLNLLLTHKLQNYLAKQEVSISEDP